MSEQTQAELKKKPSLKNELPAGSVQKSQRDLRQTTQHNSNTNSPKDAGQKFHSKPKPGKKNSLQIIKQYPIAAALSIILISLFGLIIYFSIKNKTVLTGQLPGTTSHQAETELPSGQLAVDRTEQPINNIENDQEQSKIYTLEDFFNPEKLVEGTKEVDHGEIFLIKNGWLYQIDTSEMVVEKLDIGKFGYLAQLTFTSDGQYLFAQADTDAGIILYSFEKEELINITTDKEHIGRNPRVQQGNIAPNNQYFIVNSPSLGNMGVSVYDFRGKLIEQLSGTTHHWAPNGTKFALSRGEFVLSHIPTGPEPENGSLYLIELTEKSLTKTLLKEATGQFSYTPLEWTDDSNLIYMQTTYIEPFPTEPTIEEINDREAQEYWMQIYQNPEISYWRLNIDNNTKEKLSSYDIKPQDHRKITYSPNKTWQIITETELYEEQGSSLRKINYYLTDLDETVKIKLNAQEAIWRPAAD